MTKNWCAAIHAADVLQTVHFMLLEGDAARYLRRAQHIHFSWYYSSHARAIILVACCSSNSSPSTTASLRFSRCSSPRLSMTLRQAGPDYSCPTTSLEQTCLQLSHWKCPGYQVLQELMLYVDSWTSLLAYQLHVLTRWQNLQFALLLTSCVSESGGSMMAERMASIRSHLLVRLIACAAASMAQILCNMFLPWCDILGSTSWFKHSSKAALLQLECIHC